jgi:hypothetical protein
MKSTLETCVVNLRLLYLDKMRRVYFTRVSCIPTKGDAFCVHTSPLSQLKETLVVNLRLFYLDDGPSSGAHRSVLVTSFYAARYIVGMFVTGVPN